MPELEVWTGCKIKKTILDRQINFLSPEEFARYYFATWLYEKTEEKLARSIEVDHVIEAVQRTSLMRWTPIVRQPEPLVKV